MRLAERNGLPFTLGDLMLMYVVSRNPKYDKYYFTTRRHFNHLVDRLYDTEKWGNVLVKVSENFEWGPINPLLDYPFPTRSGLAVERPYKIPRVRGFPSGGDKPGTYQYFYSWAVLHILTPYSHDFPSHVDCSAPNKGLFITSRWPYLIALLRCANRDAPTLLGYEPTYSGFAHRKDKSNMVRKNVDLATVAGQALQMQHQAQDLSTSNLSNRGEQPEKIPVEQPEQQDKDPTSAIEAPRPHRRRQSRPSCKQVDRRAEKRAKVVEDNVDVLEGSHDGDSSGSLSEPVAFVLNFRIRDIRRG